MKRILIVVAAALAAACSDTSVSPSPGPSSASSISGTTFAPQFLVGAGDIGRCGSRGAEQTALLLDTLDGTVFTAGDNAYPSGRDQDFRDCYAPSWGRHRGRTQPSPGNHEYETAGASGYFNYFGSRAGSAAEGYYSYSLGAWRIFSLNSEIPVSAGSPQAVWLQSQLAAAGPGCSAAYWHRPLFSSGPHGDNRDMRDLYRILYDGGVEFVVTGHDHIYERFARLDADGRPDPAKGVREFVVGTGGTPMSMPLILRPGSEVQASAWGVIRFELVTGSYSWRFVPVSGESFQDSGREECH